MSHGAHPPARPKLTLSKPLPPAAAYAIARISGGHVAAGGEAGSTARPPSLAKPGARVAKAATVPAPAPRKPAPPTPQAARKQRQLWRDQDLLTCRTQFPVVFCPEHPLPLAIGVRAELGRVLGRTRAERLLAQWTRWRPYLVAIAAGGKRYHLDGTEAGVIEPRHQAAAQAALAAKSAPQPGAA